MTERRMVAVSWAIPPALFPRAIQVSRLLKGLKRLGWGTTVVTVDDSSRDVADPRDAELAALYSPHYEVAAVPARMSKEPPWDLPHRWKYGPLTRMEEYWVLDAASEARRTFWRDAEVLVTFAQPWRDHFVGLAFGRPRLPWIAHFSDPWVDSLYYADSAGDHRDLDVSREAAIMHRCDLAVFTNQHAADLVMKKYSAAVQRKARVVPHAWDPDLAPLVESRLDAAKAPRPFRIGYVGALLTGRRTADDVFAALAALHSKLGLHGRLDFTIVGSGSGTGDARHAVERMGLQSLVSFQPQVAYLESLAAMRRSDVLLVLDAAAGTSVFLPSKLADYLMVERTMIGITPAHGASADLIRSCGFPVVAPGDVDAIATAIERLLTQHESGVPLPIAPPEIAHRFRLDTVSAAFAAVLDEAVTTFSWKKRWL
jgi:glycosyltransferase involved in cell wall biosynthesis